MFVYYNYTFLLYVTLFLSLSWAQNRPSILVIGAGPAGIAAATRLMNNNFSNVQIFEAENRIGGRIKSVWYGEAYIDLGAQWCHGENDNIVYELTEKYNILQHTYSPVRLIYSDGNYIDDEVTRSLLDFAENLNLDEETEAVCKGMVSTDECFEKRFTTVFTEKYKNDNKRLRTALDAEDIIRNFVMLFPGAFSLTDLSRRSSYRPCEGDLRLSWNGYGYKTVLDIMIKQFPDPLNQLPISRNIFLNKEVTKIALRKDNLKILVQSNNDIEEEFDHVIFTPSVGVLKATYKTLFEPSLPEIKINAIDAMNMGAFIKIILHFPENWWKTDEFFGFVFTPEDKAKIISEFDRGPIKNGRSWLESSLGFFQSDNNPKVLMGFFLGETVSEIETAPDEVLIDGCMYLFRTFLGKNYTIIEPDRVIRSTWHSNPHFGGTTAHESVRGNNTDIREALAIPLENENGTPTLLFAGEATHPYYYYTVHGAIETGYREADRLINFYTQND